MKEIDQNINKCIATITIADYKRIRQTFLYVSYRNV